MLRVRSLEDLYLTLVGERPMGLDPDVAAGFPTRSTSSTRCEARSNPEILSSFRFVVPIGSMEQQTGSEERNSGFNLASHLVEDVDLEGKPAATSGLRPIGLSLISER